MEKKEKKATAKEKKKANYRETKGGDRNYM